MRDRKINIGTNPANSANRFGERVLSNKFWGRGIRIKIFFVLVMLFSGLESCSQITTERADNEMLIGKWEAMDSTSFRGKVIEFLPGQQVTLILSDGGKQSGQYEINDSTIHFSIGDALPFKMKFRFEDDVLFLNNLAGERQIKYIRIKD